VDFERSEAATEGDMLLIADRLLWKDQEEMLHPKSLKPVNTERIERCS
jgi:hypothetical protein